VEIMRGHIEVPARRTAVKGICLILALMMVFALLLPGCSGEGDYNLPYRGPTEGDSGDNGDGGSTPPPAPPDDGNGGIPTPPPPPVNGGDGGGGGLTPPSPPIF
jgi:hypothetical protein